MTDSISQSELFKLLQEGIRATSKLIHKRTEYHGGPVGTEYMMTAEIARAFIEDDFDVNVEYQYGKMINVLTKKAGVKPRGGFGRERVDVAVLSSALIPRVIIEIKIGHGFGVLKKDLDRITKAIGALNDLTASKVRGVLVFEIYVPATKKRRGLDKLTEACARREKKRQGELAIYATKKQNFRFTMHSLQADNAGFVAPRTEMLGDEETLERDGHVTRYHAFLVSRT